MDYKCIICDSADTRHLQGTYAYCQPCWNEMCLSRPHRGFTDPAGNTHTLTYKKAFCWFCLRRTVKSFRECKGSKSVTCETCATTR